MLKTMRKNVKSLAPTLWIVIAAFIIAIFAVWGGAGRLGEARAANTLVWVGKEKISAGSQVIIVRFVWCGLNRTFEDKHGVIWVERIGVVRRSRNQRNGMTVDGSEISW